MVWHVGRDGSLGGQDGLSCLGLDSPFLFLMGLVAWSIAIWFGYFFPAGCIC